VTATSGSESAATWMSRKSDLMVMAFGTCRDLINPNVKTLADLPFSIAERFPERAIPPGSEQRAVQIEQDAADGTRNGVTVRHDFPVTLRRASRTATWRHPLDAMTPSLRASTRPAPKSSAAPRISVTRPPASSMRRVPAA
jgi:hypothetical protein